jgi:beta-glucosidase
MWGVEDLTKPERFAKAVKAGTAIFSDMADPTELQKAYDQGLVSDADLDGAIAGLLEEMFALGLFDNPYVDEDNAAAVIGNDTVNALGEKAQRQSVTLLRGGDVLPLDTKATKKVYAYATGRTKIERVGEKFRASFAEVAPGYELVDTPEEADLAIVWARPDIALFEDDQPGSILSIDPRDNGVDVDRVVEIEKAVPTILVVNFTNPWLIGELEPEAAAVVGTFEISPENLLRSLAGVDGGPAGKLPMSLPASEDTGPRDVPGKYIDGYAYTDRDGNVYEAGYGQRF